MEKNNGKKGTETLTENEKKSIEELAIEFYGDYARPITVEDKRCIKFIEFQIEAIEKYIVPYIKEIILNSRDGGKSYLQQYGGYEEDSRYTSI